MLLGKYKILWEYEHDTDFQSKIRLFWKIHLIESNSLYTQATLFFCLRWWMLALHLFVLDQKQIPPFSFSNNLILLVFSLLIIIYIYIYNNLSPFFSPPFCISEPLSLLVVDKGVSLCSYVFLNLRWGNQTYVVLSEQSVWFKFVFCLFCKICFLFEQKVI